MLPILFLPENVCLCPLWPFRHRIQNECKIKTYTLQVRYLLDKQQQLSGIYCWYHNSTDWSNLDHIICALNNTLRKATSGEASTKTHAVQVPHPMEGLSVHHWHSFHHFSWPLFGRENPNLHYKSWWLVWNHSLLSTFRLSVAFGLRCKPPVKQPNPPSLGQKLPLTNY